MRIRIGIDVGGTFTHAVAIDHDTHELIAHAVVPTTHSSKYSVSEGIIQSFRLVLEKCGVSPDDVVFVAHSTTQATNALLEGDVAKTGIIGMGTGLEGAKAKIDTNIPDIELSMGKYLHTAFVFVDSGADTFSKDIREAVRKMKEQGCQVIVASEAFGVDHPEKENAVTEESEKEGLPAVAGNEISQLYGLKVRTRTAVINASILPKMTNTALMTEESIRKSGIKAPLMIMRSDGGVMDIGQMKKRPILTLLSGPAAGIAGALMYANISYGIFLEVGGTSTDIAAIKNGKAMLKGAEIGGHATYLRTLDSRTVGIAGGSMVRVSNKKILDVGPRSAHIAGYDYGAFCEEEHLENYHVVLIRPGEDDPDDYLVLEDESDNRIAVTLTDAAMMVGSVRPGDYAYGNITKVIKEFAVLEEYMGKPGKEIAEEILNKASSHITPVIDSLMEDYKMDPALVQLVGGGGGCTALVPWLGKITGMDYVITKNAEVLSAIGAGMAMLRDTVEKSVIHPTGDDLVKIEEEAKENLIRMGADPDSIEVFMEIDQQKNLVRASATGSMKMERQKMDKKKLDEEGRKNIAAKSMHAETEKVTLEGKTESLYLYAGEVITKSFFGIKKKKKEYRVLDEYGTVKLPLTDAVFMEGTKEDLMKEMTSFLKDSSSYSDAGQILGEVYFLHGSRINDYSTVLDQEQVESLIRAECRGLKEDANSILIVKKR